MHGQVGTQLHGLQQRRSLDAVIQGRARNGSEGVGIESRETSLQGSHHQAALGQ
jgi:hypothetical protein